MIHLAPIRLGCFGHVPGELQVTALAGDHITARPLLLQDASSVAEFPDPYGAVDNLVHASVDCARVVDMHASARQVGGLPSGPYDRRIHHLRQGFRAHTSVNEHASVWKPVNLRQMIVFAFGFKAMGHVVLIIDLHVSWLLCTATIPQGFHSVPQPGHLVVDYWDSSIPCCKRLSARSRAQSEALPTFLRS